jgi:hypothetical protein
MNLKRIIASTKKFTAILMLLIFGFANLLFSQSKDKNVAHLPVFKTASDWIEYSSKFIFQSSKEQNKIPSPSIFDNDINGFNDDLSKLRLNHYTIKTQSNLRNFYNLRNQFGLLIEQANRFDKKLKKTDAILIHQRHLIDALSNHSLVSTVLNNSIASVEITAQFKKLYLILDSLKNNIELLQKSYTLNTSTCTYIILSAKEEDEMINREMDNITKNLLNPEELSFLHLTENNYPAFWPTFKTTCRQKVDLLLSYSKASLWDLIFLRVVVLIFAFLPLWYVKKIYRKYEGTIYTQHFRYVHNHTALMAPTIMLVLAPLLFHYPPMLLLDMLFMTIAFSVMTIVSKENKSLKKLHVFGLLIFYVLLKIDNLIITVTMVDRILFSLSIFTLPVFYQLLKWVKQHVENHRVLLIAVLYSVMILISLGWIFNLTGNFILSKNITLAAFEGLFFMLMLHFAINGIGDYILMTGDYFYRKKIKFNPELLDVHFRIRRYLIFAAILYWVIALLINLNLFHFIANPVLEYVRMPRTIGNVTFSFGNLLIFIFLSIFIFSIYELIKKIRGVQKVN